MTVRELLGKRTVNGLREALLISEKIQMKAEKM